MLPGIHQVSPYEEVWPSWLAYGALRENPKIQTSFKLKGIKKEKDATVKRTYWRAENFVLQRFGLQRFESGRMRSVCKVETDVGSGVEMTKKRNYRLIFKQTQ